MLTNQKGLTLIEILSATVVLSVVIMAFVAISAYTGLSDRNTDMKAAAMRIAEQKIHTVRSYVSLHGDAGSLADEQEGEYTITYSLMPLGETALSDYTLPPAGQRVSLQAAVLISSGLEPEPRLLTVVVSWGDEL